MLFSPSVLGEFNAAIHRGRAIAKRPSEIALLEK